MPSLHLISICTHHPSPRQGDRCHRPCGSFVTSEAAGLPVFDQGFAFDSHKNQWPECLWPGEEAPFTGKFSHLKAKIFKKFNTSQLYDADTKNIILEVHFLRVEK